MFIKDFLHYDERKNHASGTTLLNVAKAVVVILPHPERTLNKRVFISDATFTQQQVLARFGKYTNAEWTVKQVTRYKTEKQAAEHLAKGNFSAAVGGYIIVLAYSELEANIFEDNTSNMGLGVPTLSLKQIFQEVVERNMAGR